MTCRRDEKRKAIEITTSSKFSQQSPVPESERALNGLFSDFMVSTLLMCIYTSKSSKMTPERKPSVRTNDFTIAIAIAISG